MLDELLEIAWRKKVVMAVVPGPDGATDYRLGRPGRRWGWPPIDVRVSATGRFLKAQTYEPDDPGADDDGMVLLSLGELSVLLELDWPQAPGVIRGRFEEIVADLDDELGDDDRRVA